MAGNDLVNYPRGQVSYGSGQLQHATNWDATLSNGVSLKATLRLNPSGYVIGNKAVTGSVSLMLPPDGAERDFITPFKKDEIVNFVLEIPQANLSIECVISDLNWSASEADGVSLTVSFTGRMVDPEI